MPSRISRSTGRTMANSTITAPRSSRLILDIFGLLRTFTRGDRERERTSALTPAPAFPAVAYGNVMPSNRSLMRVPRAKTATATTTAMPATSRPYSTIAAPLSSFRRVATNAWMNGMRFIEVGSPGSAPPPAAEETMRVCGTACGSSSSQLMKLAARVSERDRQVVEPQDRAAQRPHDGGHDDGDAHGQQAVLGEHGAPVVEAEPGGRAVEEGGDGHRALRFESGGQHPPATPACLHHD